MYRCLTVPHPPRAVTVAIALVTSLLPASGLRAQTSWAGRARLQPEQCIAATGNGQAWIQRAIAATGMSRIEGAVVFEGSESSIQFYQSDRPYPPYIGATSSIRFTFDPASGTERRLTMPPGGAPGRSVLMTPTAAFGIRGDTTLIPIPRFYEFYEPSRFLNPLAVLADWRSEDVTVVATCDFRGYPRVVLSRGRTGERLYLQTGSAVPVKYERIEPHYLWGQVLAEYVYTTWWQAGPVMLPVTTARYIDGVEELHRDLDFSSQSLGETVPLASAWPALPVPAVDQRASTGWLSTPQPVDTVRVGDNTYLLTTPTYTHAVTMAKDTVFLFDATTAEWRSQADSAWIAKLFPGRHAMVLVVTDLAWPHIAGVRFWAARGAAIATHPLSIPFLTRVIDRRWELTPDIRNTTLPQTPSMLPIGSRQSFGGGAVHLAPIDGVASEGALMAWLPSAKFLWAGDYIQSATSPTVYAREVISATQREGFTPVQAAAQHLKLTAWSTILETNAMP